MAERTPSKAGEPDHHFAPPAVPNDTDYRHAPPASLMPDFRTEYQASNADPLSPESSVLSPRIVVVGVCSSGKSTLVRALRERGFSVFACAQEHSGVPYLWQRSEPDVLVYLDASIHTIRQRRRAKWRQAMLDEERHRLAHAREHCDLYIPTDGLSPHDVASRVITFLNNHHPAKNEEPETKG
jgi:dienelactone hydrolase